VGVGCILNTTVEMIIEFYRNHITLAQYSESPDNPGPFNPKVEGSNRRVGRGTAEELLTSAVLCGFIVSRHL
jgi:hypothetical protein